MNKIVNYYMNDEKENLSKYREMQATKYIIHLRLLKEIDLCKNEKKI